MSVKYILSQSGAKMGLNPSDTNERSVLLRFLNEAARELYDQGDLPGSLWELPFKVNGDQTISLPWFVGGLRGIRELASMQAWHANQMRPRYNQFNWPDMWRNWRLKNIQCLQATVTNQSVGVISAFAVEDPPIVVTLTGQTMNSNSITEIVTISAPTVNTENQFIDYYSVTKDRVSIYDITLSDVDGKVLTSIPNSELTAQYQIIDVSACPWLPNSVSSQDNYLEILYKKRLPYLTDDNQEFPAFGYDDVIVNKMMQLWAEEQGKVDLANAYDAKATRTAGRKKEDQNRETEDVVALTSNPHDNMLKKIGTGLRRRYALYAGRRY